MFHDLSEYVKAKEYLEKALAIMKEIGDRKVEATCYGNLGNAFQDLSEYQVGCLSGPQNIRRKHLRSKTGDREEEICYGNLGVLFRSFSEYVKAKEYLE